MSHACRDSDCDHAPCLDTTLIEAWTYTCRCTSNKLAASCHGCCDFIPWCSVLSCRMTCLCLATVCLDLKQGNRPFRVLGPVCVLMSDSTTLSYTMAVTQPCVLFFLGANAEPDSVCDSDMCTWSCVLLCYCLCLDPDFRSDVYA